MGMSGERVVYALDQAVAHLAGVRHATPRVVNVFTFIDYLID